LKTNPVDYKQWYQDYGKSWYDKNPDYQKKRRTKQNKTKSHSSQKVIRTLPDDKKDELIPIKLVDSNSTILTDRDKKDKLTHSYYVIKAIDIQFIAPLNIDKKDQLTLLK